MEMNKYLKELGLTWYDLPGNYISKISFRIRLRRRWYRIKRAFCFAFASLEKHAPNYREDMEYIAYDRRNKIDKNGFCEYEFFSLDYSMALYIYPRLCEFRNEYAECGTPSCFCTSDNDAINQEKWFEVLDKMIMAFKYIIKEPKGGDYETQDKIIEEGLKLFAEYYRCLWW